VLAFGTWRKLAAACWVVALLPAGTTVAASKKSAHPAGAQTTTANPCKADDEDADAESLKFALGNTCVEIDGEVNASFSRVLNSSQPGFPQFFRRFGTPSQDRDSYSVWVKLGFTGTQQTAWGELETRLLFKWLKSKGDDQSLGFLQIEDAYASLAGWKVGYTDTLMNFWTSEFEFTATAPKRTVASVAYEREIISDTKLAIALESGPPTTPVSSGKLATVNWDDPVLAGRWLYEKDDWEVHWSALVHQLKVGGGAVPLPFIPSTSAIYLGWAASFGLTIPMKAVGEDDYISLQAVYARNASAYLGTNADLSSLASILPFPAQTSGWSLVASYHREWSEQFESNFFASRLVLDISLSGAQPSIRSARYAANLKWKPIKKLKLGPEIGYVRLQADPGRGGNVLPALRGHALIGTLVLGYEF